MSDKAVGLYEKYLISRKDGSSEVGGKHEGCKYFVLDLDHDAYAAIALNAYALACETMFPALAADLFQIVKNAKGEKVKE